MHTTHLHTDMTQNPESLRLLAKAFTRPVFAAMARTGDFRPSLEFLIRNRIATESQLKDATLSEWFEGAWNHLAKSYRNEYVYKNELATRLIFGRHSPRTAGFQVELAVGRSIVDVAVANGTTTAYEIKTEFDTARRLQSQTDNYLKAFDKVFVVTHPDYVARYERELDPRVGLIVLSQRSSLAPYRDAQSNAENVDPSVIFRCLRRSEYLNAIKELFGTRPELPNGLIASHCEKLFSKISSVDAHQILVKALRARTTDKSTVDFVAQLPSSLRALGYATPLSGRQRNTILELLSRPAGLSLST